MRPSTAAPRSSAAQETSARCFSSPTVLRIDGLQAASEHRVVREETFFPLHPVAVPAAAPSLLDDAIDFMNANRYGLRNWLWSRDPAVVDRFLARMATAATCASTTRT